MKFRYIILPALLIIIGAGCQSTAEQSQVVEKIVEKECPQPVAAQPTRMRLAGAVTLSVPEGFSVWQQNSEGGEAAVVMPNAAFEQVTSGVFEGELPPPFVTVNAYENPKKMSADDWVKKNPAISSYSVKKGEMKGATIGGRPGVVYETDGLYLAKYYVAVSEDKNWVIVAAENYTDLVASPEMTKMTEVIKTLVIGAPNAQKN